MDNKFGKHFMGNTSGGEEHYSKLYSDDDDDDDDDDDNDGDYGGEFYSRKEVTPRHKFF